MKKERYLSTVVCGVLLIVMILGIVGYFWVSIPIYPNPTPEVETEEELVEALRKDVPDIVYPSFLKEEYGWENVIYKMHVPLRTRFAPVKGYSISCDIIVGDKTCHIFMDMYAGENSQKDCNFQYRDVEGYVCAIDNKQRFGLIDFVVGGYQCYIDYRPSDEQSMAEEELSEINAFALEIAYKLIDMRLDGDTIGK